ncbi:unnamed protein product (macronuclear) [Paramecium tetraurelia]|uniref:Uncharacterized protein n=1 Tax=Paramecium tetraurelia TaxID=5888 RepID=A0DHS9_PARTE|nr:uncharacterized protein GSPATT00016983001 [Paramecium tetraurelia]CAK82596.1 unnamed protein product [Paramecium tetraurelia]|eukprot:XP_001449993.1 hypothetical protein (macronuclear) [Paramecium tetraurelia strain d4-2]
MQITPFIDAYKLDDLVSAQKHKIIAPVFQNYKVETQDYLISPNGQFIAIMYNMEPMLKQDKQFSIVQLFNIITGEQSHSQQVDQECPVISMQFSFDSSIFVVLDFFNLILFNVEEKNKIAIIKLKSDGIVSIDSENNVILGSSNNQIIVYSTKKAFQETLQFDRLVDHLQKLGANKVIYICGCNQYLFNLQNNKVLRRWMNHEFEIKDQIIYKKLLMIQSWYDKFRSVKNYQEIHQKFQQKRDIQNNGGQIISFNLEILYLQNKIANIECFKECIQN